MKPIRWKSSIAFALASVSAWAYADQPRSGSISLEDARRAAVAAEQKAVSLNGTGSIAVVDDGGHLMCFVRLDNTFPAGAAVSQGKARTAAVFRKSTGEFEEIVNNGRFSMTALPDFTPLRGGVPIVRDGVVIGAIGVSGAASAAQDEEIALAGAEALAMKKVSMNVAEDEFYFGFTGDSPENLAEAPGRKNLVNKTSVGTALQGYDPVGYFTQNKAVKGDPKYRTEHRGGTYYFASAENKAAFEKNPDKYAPAYGGYCGYAVSINRLSPINVNFFQIIDEKLILQHNQKAFDKFNDGLNANVAKAEANWPGLVNKNGTTMKVLVNVDKAGLALEGFDPVSYFTQPKPVKGKSAHMATFNGANYYFSSEENRAKFESDPAKYAPAFGGYCGYAASINKISTIDPLIYQIIDDRLVLQHTPKAFKLFNNDADGNLAKADKNWPGLVKKNGK